MKVSKRIAFVLISIFTLITVLTLTVILSLYSSPNFFVWFLRQQPDAIATYVPEEYNVAKNDVLEILDITYESKYKENKIDVYYPKNYDNKKLPTIIWTHGGSFIGGDKSAIKVFGTLVAKEGYTFVSVNYELAPENTYPGPAIQLTEVVKYLKKNINKYQMIDLERVVIGGDSAGAQIAAHFVATQINSELRDEVKIEQVLTPKEIKAVLLFCGPYDMNELDKQFTGNNSNSSISNILSFFVKQIGWSYFGYSGWKSGNEIKQTNIVDQVTNDYPPTYLTDGNRISFMAHAESLEKKLDELGVIVDSYYPSKEDSTKDFNHEYQFNFKDYPVEAFINLEYTLNFLKENIN
ncbi:alpha/beta hydrolase [Haploplasma axanthum]|uniref:Acetyl esterase n=1 Tax=Haploplasma axanthum TaxID=29552 RepID=A0A449BBM4_HAPAX|nr:alpha/beta hydrolase [Haploplasma axanthum]VEU79838.1 Acetyl esterase [Haploplasma axanthum]